MVNFRPIRYIMNKNTADGHIQIYYSICIWKVKDGNREESYKRFSDAEFLDVC